MEKLLIPLLLLLQTVMVVSSSSINVTVNKYDNEDPVITSLTTNMNSVVLNTSNPIQNFKFLGCSDNQSVSSVNVTNATQILVTGNSYIFKII